jgi:hypothetical protein
MDRRQEARVGDLVLEEDLLLDLHDPVDHIVVARLAQRLLGSEVVPEQARRHAGRLGDVADRGAVDAALGEQADRGVPDPRPGRQVLERRIPRVSHTPTPYTHVR